MNDSPDRARPHRKVLADQLTAAGAIRTRPWVDAFADVPRHLFVPRWYEQEADARGITVWCERQATGTDADLAAVYRDQTLVTALDPATAEQVDETAWTGIPTSSSTLPSLMARMLEDLAVEDGHRVLEIGTGTGYNAALLSHRIGEHLVHSMDIDPALVGTARQRLAEAGFVPQLAVGDGSHGHPAGGTFDRIIATCSVPAVPDAWLDHSKPGTLVLTDLNLGIEGGLVTLRVDGSRRAVGHFAATCGRFMAARTDATSYPAPQWPDRAPTADTRPTTVTAADIRANYPLGLLLAFHLPGAQLVHHIDEAGAMALQLQHPDGSWARAPLADGPATVTHGGVRDLWQQVEAAWQWWNDAGRPSQDRFGYAREPDGRAYAWHIPDGTRWDLPARA
ncbi:methyltransferase domain-containing protein [Streptomyces sp. NPDC007083]|uniref:methyltransferase domain-containing protein n=1 Tax=Streptomyces sp. NPDC007083 TaxID=3156913 RepID=UPI0033E58CE5